LCEDKTGSPSQSRVAAKRAADIELLFFAPKGPGDGPTMGENGDEKYGPGEPHPPTPKRDCLLSVLTRLASHLVYVVLVWRIMGRIGDFVPLCALVFCAALAFFHSVLQAPFGWQECAVSSAGAAAGSHALGLRVTQPVHVLEVSHLGDLSPASNRKHSPRPPPPR